MNGELPHLVSCFWGTRGLIRDEHENRYGQYPLLSALINVFCVLLYVQRVPKHNSQKFILVFWGQEPTIGIANAHETFLLLLRIVYTASQGERSTVNHVTLPSNFVVSRNVSVNCLSRWVLNEKEELHETSRISILTTRSNFTPIAVNMFDNTFDGLVGAFRCEYLRMLMK